MKRSGGFIQTQRHMSFSYGHLPASGRNAALLLLALLVVAWPAADEAAAQALPSGDTPAQLQPGDLVRVQVWRQEEFSGEFFVTDQGVIGHPLYRSIYAVRRPVQEVEEALRIFLQEFESQPNFVVEAFLQVAVSGHVRQPSVYPLRPGTTVAQAVAQAGGATEQGRMDRVILRRGGSEYQVDLTDTTGRSREVTIRSGDEIAVERRRNIMREYVIPIISVAGSIASIVRLAR